MYTFMYIRNTTRTYLIQNRIVFQVKPTAKVDGSTGRNINANRLLSKCNFYFCLLGKTKIDHMLVLRERK